MKAFTCFSLFAATGRIKMHASDIGTMTKMLSQARREYQIFLTILDPN